MLAFAFGPLYGGFLTDVLSWRVIFWADVALLLVAAALLFALLRDLPRGQTGTRVDLLELPSIGIKGARKMGTKCSIIRGVL